MAHLHLTAVEFCQRLSPDVDSFALLRNKCLCFIKSYGWRSLKFFVCLPHLPFPPLPPPPPHLGICLCVLRVQVHGCVGLRSSCRCLPQLLSIYGSRVSRWVWSLWIPADLARQCPEDPLLRLALQIATTLAWHIPRLWAPKLPHACLASAFSYCTIPPGHRSPTFCDNVLVNQKILLCGSLTHP